MSCAICGEVRPRRTATVETTEMCLVCDHLYFQPAREEIPMSAPTSLRRVHRVCDDWHQRVIERARELHAAH